MLAVSEVKEWLNTLADNDSVGVDEGGITLVSFLQPEAYLEVGGGLDEDEEDDEG